jgi:serine O-acetyltransferase
MHLGEGQQLRGVRKSLLYVRVSLRNRAVWAIAEYRFRKWVQESQHVLLYPAVYILQLLAEVLTGIVISNNSTIGPGLYFGHAGGIYIGGEFGANCNVAQGVTVGYEVLTGNRGLPQIGDDVYIGVGAVIYGPLVIGDRARIGANSVVNRDVPADATAIGAPARIVRIGDERISADDPRSCGTKPADRERSTEASDQT